MALLTTGLAAAAAGILRRAHARTAETIAEPLFYMRLSIRGVLVWLLVLGATGWAVITYARWDAARDEARRWRQAIGEASSAGREVLARAGVDIASLDAALIQTIGDLDAQLKQAEEKLRRPPPQPEPRSAPPDPRPRCERIPPECLQ